MTMILNLFKAILLRYGVPETTAAHAFGTLCSMMILAICAAIIIGAVETVYESILLFLVALKSTNDFTKIVGATVTSLLKYASTEFDNTLLEEVRDRHRQLNSDSGSLLDQMKSQLERDAANLHSMWRNIASKKN